MRNGITNTMPLRTPGNWLCSFVAAMLLSVAPGHPLNADQYGAIPYTAELNPTVGMTSGIRLPVESLRAVHGLDLEQPAKVKLPITGPTSESSPTLTMPALVAPQVSKPLARPATDRPPLKVADSSGNQRGDARPFQPSWRSPSGGPSANSEPEVEEAPLPTPPSFVKEAFEEGDKKSATESDEQSKTNEATEQEPSDTAKADSNPGDTKEPQAEAAPAKPLPPLTRNQIYLRNKLRKVLTYYYRRPLNSRDHDTWEVMHQMLAYELHSRIRAGGPRGESTTAIGWLCYNNACKRKQLMRVNDEGKLRALYGVGLQGHMGQFLAMLAQCNVDPTYPIRVQNHEFTIEDLIVSEQETCYPNTELTFKLISLMHYLPSDTQWVNDRGEQWSMERLVEEELKQPIRGAACGGTHRLSGLSLAVRKRQARGEPVEGVWKQAADFTKKYQQYCYRLQNSDGSFSTEWFRGPGRERDINRRCRTTGHLLEWILYQVEDRELRSNRVVSGVNYLTNLLYSNSNNEWEIGPLCHALHALTLYDKRVFQPYDQEQKQAQGKTGETARQGRSSGRRR